MTDETTMLQIKWEFFDWEQAEKDLVAEQEKLSSAAIQKNFSLVRKLQRKIVQKFENRCLAVRHVSNSNSAVGVDGVKWTTSLEKIQAAIKLGEQEYHASPMRVIKFCSKNNGKIRRGHLLTYFDRAMSVLHGYALLPVLEATGDKKSFGFRPERSTQDAHSCVLEGLKGNHAPRWVVCADVKAFYSSIHHAWLLEHAPMDRKILAEFLNAGIVFAGELFPSGEYGISEGSNLSPYLGNFVLDGMQSAIYRGLKDFRKVDDYADGNMIRFADDVIITVRSQAAGEKVMEILKDFLSVRGLQLSPEKTKIVHVSEGFTFLSRSYIRKDGLIFSYPAERAVEKFISELKEYVENSVLSQRKLILSLNKKLQGWATYYRSTDALEAFKKVDIALQTVLLEKTRALYPKLPLEKLKNRFWYEEHDGRYSYALPDNKSIKLIRLEDTVLLVPHKAKIGFNPFVDKNYVEYKSQNREIQNVTGRYKAVWERQGGKCHYCGRPILNDQSRAVVAKDLTKSATTKNLAYVHKICATHSYDEVWIDEENFYRDYDVLESLENLLSDNKKISKQKTWKYRPLTEYFEGLEKYSVTLDIDEIEEILGFKLPKASRFSSFWYRKENYRSIASTWTSAGYAIRRLDLDRRRITFCKFEEGVGRLEIPSELTEKKLPDDAIFELESFFEYVIKKYGL